MKRKFEKLDKQIDRILSNSERRVNSRYSDMLRELRHKLSDYHGEYAVDGNLTLQEMQKYGRLDKFNKEVAKITRTKYIPIAREIRKSLRESLVTAFETTKGFVEEEASKTLRGVLKDETIKAIEQSPHSGLKLNDRLQRRRGEVVTRVQETLTQGMNRGESYRDMAARIDEELIDDYAKSKRIIRTEGHRVQEAGKKESLDYANNQGVKMKKTWVSSSDERVRDKHQALDGTTIDYEDDFISPATGGKGPHPGAMNSAEDDINCRCIFIVEVVNVE